MATYLPSFCILFKQVLEHNTNLASPSVLNTIISMKHLVPALETQKVGNLLIVALNILYTKNYL
jgi:hypothetical protein